MYIFSVSSVVIERSPVKRRVSGSNPLRGAKTEFGYLIYMVKIYVNMKEKIIELRKIGFSYNEICEKLNCSKSTVSYYCSKLDNNSDNIKFNIKLKNKKQEKIKSFLMDTSLIDDVVKMRKEKKTYDEIKNLTGLSKHTISKICREYGLVSNRKRGQLSDDVKNKIIELYSKLKSTRKVSKILEISRDTVSKYVSVEKITPEERKKNKIRNVIEWRKRVKMNLVSYKGGKCEKCGYNKCVRSLEFHHLDPNEKDFTISGKSWSFERLKKEVDKCILVCSNCHNEIHYLEEEAPMA